MEGFKKCYGLLLLLFITLGLSLSVCSGDSSALRHEITNIPLYMDVHYSPSDPNVSIENQAFYFDWPSDYTQFSYLKKFTYFDVIANDGVCSYGGHYHEIPNSNVPYYYFPSYYNPPFNTPNPDYFACHQTSAWGTPSGEFTYHPQFDVGSIGETSGVPLIQVYFLRSMASNGYYYEYNAIPLSHASVNSNSGIHYSWAYKMSDLFNNDVIPTKFSQLRIPLGFSNSSDIGSLTAGRHFDIDGTFHFPGLSSSSDLTFSSAFNDYGQINLLYRYINSSGSQASSGTISCQRSLTYAELDGLGDYNWSYSCPFDLPADMLYITFTLDVSTAVPSGVSVPLSDRWIFDTTSDWTWSGGFVTTDYDSTPGSDWSGDYNGGNLDATPGSSDPTNSEDWYSSLTNLFNFDFFNPFAPLFQLFTNNSSCANIPIIAGMLHSEETTYCPWFPSSVRNILTPVLSLASVMLIFGFAVRWLGSSSGNMFEDSGSISPPGYSATGGTAIKRGWRLK